MTDYHPLIQRAVDGLAKNTGDARRALYERARAALVAQLRSVEPALSESDITKERLALEEAIRKVEADAARKALGETRTPARGEPRVEPRLEPRRAAPQSRSSGTDGKPAAAEPASPLRRERLGTAADDLSPAGRTSARDGERSPPPHHDDAPAAATAAAEGPSAKPSARNRILGARTSSLREEGLKGYRNVVHEVDDLGTATAKAAQSARDTRDSYGATPRQRTAEDFAAADSLEERIERHFDETESPPAEADNLHGIESDYGFDHEEPETPRFGRPHPPADSEIEEDEEEYAHPRPSRSYRRWAKLAVYLVILFGFTATAWEYRANIGAVYDFVRHVKAPTPSQTTQTQAPQTKFSGRVPQEPIPGQAPVPGAAPGTQPAPEVAQRAVLLEQDANDPQGKRYPGSVTWRTETVSPGPGLAPELEVRADIVIPERHMTVTFSLRRNTDKALPASHTIQIMFNLPPNFPGEGISSVPGIFAKNAEEATGTPLAGISVKVTDSYFLLGLSADPTLQQRNIQLLKNQEWFDIAIVYRNGGKAILAIERGPPGDRAFADAFAAWGE